MIKESRARIIIIIIIIIIVVVVVVIIPSSPGTRAGHTVAGSIRSAQRRRSLDERRERRMMRRETRMMMMMMMMMMVMVSSRLWPWLDKASQRARVARSPRCEAGHHARLRMGSDVGMIAGSNTGCAQGPSRWPWRAGAAIGGCCCCCCCHCYRCCCRCCRAVTARSWLRFLRGCERATRGPMSLFSRSE